MAKEANNIIGYSIEGKRISLEMIDNDLEQSELDFKNGKFLTHSQLKEEIEKWRTTDNRQLTTDNKTNDNP